MNMALLPRILLVLLLAILPPVAIETWDAFDVRQQREQELQGQALRLSRMASGELGRIVDGAKQLLIAVAETRPVREKDNQACAAYLARLHSRFPQYAVLYATDLTGYSWCNSGGPLSPVTSTGSAAFETATKAQQFAVSGFTVEPSTGKPILKLMLPFYDQKGALQGVVGAGLSLGWLQQYLRDKPWPAGFALTVTDGQGTVLVGFPETGMVGKPVPQALWPIWRQAADAMRPATFEAVGLDGTRRIVGYQPLRTTPAGLYVSVGLDPEAVVAAYDRTLWITLAWAVLSLVLAGAAAYSLAWRFIHRPVAQLLATAARWRDGDYTARSDASGAPEFRRLSAKLNDMAARLADREARLREVGDARRRLLAVAGHDLRQPLQSLSMAVERLRNQLASPPDPALLVRAERAIGRLTRALDTVSDVSRVESESLQPSPTVFPIEDVLLDLEDHWGHEAHRKGLHFRVLSCRTLVETDRDMLHTILDNLVGNAVRYTERGRVVVGCRRRGDWLSIHVIDTGIGIPEDKVGHIFEEFRQLQPGRGEGMGLGLWIVKKTAERLGLAVTVQSRVGTGTCFRVDLPRATRAAVSSDMAGNKPTIRSWPAA